MCSSQVLVYVLGLVLVITPVSICLRKLNRILQREKEATKSPFSEKLLRPPGESLRLKIETLREQIGDTFFKLGCYMLAPGILCLLVSQLPPIASLTFVAIVGIPCYLLGMRQWSQVKRLRTKLINHRLGFDGERYVATELTPLLTKGYQVFHDFIYDMDPGGDKTTFNIDHIAIGPEGVFLIETKAKRKSTQTPQVDLKTNELTLKDGALLFPDGKTTEKPINQAKKYAEKLQRWINKSGIQGIEVRPLVVYPGWFIKHPKWMHLGVQSARKIAERIPHLGKGRRLSDQEIQHIATRIEDKCRDVEGAH